MAFGINFKADFLEFWNLNSGSLHKTFPYLIGWALNVHVYVPNSGRFTLALKFNCVKCPDFYSFLKPEKGKMLDLCYVSTLKCKCKTFPPSCIHCKAHSIQLTSMLALPGLTYCSATLLWAQARKMSTLSLKFYPSLVASPVLLKHL